jgi:hypothetical protein
MDMSAKLFRLGSVIRHSAAPLPFSKIARYFSDSVYVPGLPPVSTPLSQRGTWLQRYFTNIHMAVLAFHWTQPPNEGRVAS